MFIVTEYAALMELAQENVCFMLTGRLDITISVTTSRTNKTNQLTVMCTNHGGRRIIRIRMNCNNKSQLNNLCRFVDIIMKADT